MRVGFITSILWSRYGRFWTRLAADAGAQTVFAETDRTVEHLQQKFLQQIPSLPLRVAVAQAMVLADCDVIVVPHLNPGTESRRGAAQDPWISELPETLATTAGITNVFGVPVSLDAAAEPLAVKFVQDLLHDGWRTRTVLDRHRNLLRPAPRTALPVTPPESTGVLGQPWLIDAHLAGLAVPGGRQLAQSELDPRLLLEEGARVMDGLADSDREVVGAASWMSRRGGIDRLLFLQDGGSDHDRWLFSQLGKVVRKPLETVTVQSLLDEKELAAHLAGVPTGN